MDDDWKSSYCKLSIDYVDRDSSYCKLSIHYTDWEGNKFWVVLPVCWLREQLLWCLNPVCWLWQKLLRAVSQMCCESHYYGTRMKYADSESNYYTHYYRHFGTDDTLRAVSSCLFICTHFALSLCIDRWRFHYVYLLLYDVFVLYRNNKDVQHLYDPWGFLPFRDL